MTELDAATLRVIADSAETAARLARLGDLAGARSALTRAEHRLADFTADKPWHARSVRLAREAVARATAMIHGSAFDRAKLARATSRAVARAKA